MAYEARSHFPDSTIHITNEIIHNPQVRIIMSIKLEKGQAYKAFLECLLHDYFMHSLNRLVIKLNLLC